MFIVLFTFIPLPAQESFGSVAWFSRRRLISHIGNREICFWGIFCVFFSREHPLPPPKGVFHALHMVCINKLRNQIENVSQMDVTRMLLTYKKRRIGRCTLAIPLFLLPTHYIIQAGIVKRIACTFSARFVV